MNHSEEAVEKILAALRNAEAPSEMNLRILRTLQRQDAIHSQRKSAPAWLSLSGTRSFAFGAAFAGLFVVALFVPALFRMKPHHAAAPENTTASLQPARAPSSPQAQVSSAPRVQTPQRPKGHKTGTARREDSQLLEAMHAPSRPAPPLPLTEQEKLLIGIAHRGDPQQLAMLNTQLRLRQENEEKADFQNFFEPPASGEKQ